MSGFMKTVSKNSSPKQAFLYRLQSWRYENWKESQSSLSLYSFIFLLLFAFPYFFSLLHGLEAAFRSCEIKVKFKDVRAHCYCASLVRALFIRHALATLFSSACTESKTQKNIELMTFVSTWCTCEYFCWMLVGPHFFFGRSLPFLILAMILKTKKICTWEVLIFSHMLFK